MTINCVFSKGGIIMEETTVVTGVLNTFATKISVFG